jgi:hypothetical protein
VKAPLERTEPAAQGWIRERPEARADYYLWRRCRYKSTDVDKKTGAVTTDKGKGINIFRHGADGKWRMAIDGWGSDIPIVK